MNTDRFKFDKFDIDEDLDLSSFYSANKKEYVTVPQVLDFTGVYLDDSDDSQFQIDDAETII